MVNQQTIDRALGTHIIVDSTNIPAGTVIATDVANNSITDTQIATGTFAKITGLGTQLIDLNVSNVDIVTGTTTGSIIGKTAANKVGFFGKAPVVQPTALTAAETTVTFVNENVPDFALSSLTAAAPVGFASLDEAQGFVEMCVNMQLRMGQLETKLVALGILA